MKTSIITVALLASGMLTIQASQFQVVERGADYNVLQKTTYEGGTNHVHRVIELATGMHYLSNGQWIESREEIEAFPRGAIARQGPYQVIFANNLNSAGAIDLQTPDGKRLRSNILGLAYEDSSTGKSVLIAKIQNSQGELISANQVLYPDAFDGVVKADVRYTYRKGGFEQDVILREQPPTPESFGLNPQTTEIEVLTEFINPPLAKIAKHKLKNNSMPDDDVNWGVVRIGRGSAFDLGEPRNSPSRAPVRRQYISAQGRNILVEGVPVQRINANLAKLPLQSRAATKLPMLASKTPVLPNTPLMQAEQKPMKLASASPSNKGFVLDYVLVDTDPGDFTFQADTTYYIANGIDFSGNLTFEGGTVIKYGTDPDNPNLMECWGDIVCDTSPYRPAIFTSVNDDTVGEPISNPDMPLMYYWCAICGSSSDAVVWHDIVIRYAAVGIAGYALQLNNCQFMDCLNPFRIDWGTCSMTNVLMVNVDNAFEGEDFAATACQLTVSGATNLSYDGWGYGTASTLALTNSLLVNVQASGNTTITTNHTAWVTDSGGQVFQSGGAGDNYLLPGSPFINAGNVTADKMGLYWFTTQTNQAIEGISVVDLGYHYPAVDGNGDPISTEVAGIPDYISDANGNGLGDAWETNNLGSFNYFASDLDPLGNSLLYDFTNNIDLSAAVQFAIEVTNTDVNTNLVPVQLNISSGVPGYISIVDNTNFTFSIVDGTNFTLEGTTWNPYIASNLVVSLSPTEGGHQIWIGLRGLPPVATPTWKEMTVTLDTTPPAIIVTNPVAGSTVSQPMIQVQGLVSEALSSLAFDVSNATGIFTNQIGYASGLFYDMNLLAFTTNSFQCYDVVLTNGLNTITLHATDLAGNTCMTNVSVTLDYSGDTTPPVIQLLWPTAGTPVDGGNFALLAQADDPTATVTVSIVDINGNTNVVSSMLARNGQVQVNNIPLSSGANMVTVTTTDAAGNSSVTNFSVTGNDLGLAMNPLTDDQLNQSSVTVTGSIGEGNYSITVNGVAATISGDPVWEATNVPVSPTGTAVINVNVYSNSVLVDTKAFLQPRSPVVRITSSEDGQLYSLSFWGMFWGYTEYWIAGLGGTGVDIQQDGTYSFYTLSTNVYSDYDEPWVYQNWSDEHGVYGGDPGPSVDSFWDIPKVVLVTGGKGPPGTTRQYTVRALMEGFTNNEESSFGGLPPDEFQIQGQTLTASAKTNSDGAVWGQTRINVSAGATPDVTPAATSAGVSAVPLSWGVANDGSGQYYEFSVEVVKDKLYWQNMVKDEIDLDSGVAIENYKASDGFMKNRANIQAVYAFYQKLFEEEPTEFYWAGLAKLAGAEVYAGLSDAENSRGIFGSANVDQFQQILINMNIAVMNDLAWQFEAYKKGGLDALQEIDAVDATHSIVDIDSWQEIDQGIQQNNTSMIQQGNELLLQREQEQVLADGYAQLNAMPLVTAGMSFFAKNPISGGPTFVSMEPFGNIANYPDRWDWISHPYVSASNTGMWPLWVGTSLGTQLGWVEIPLKTRAVGYTTFTPVY